MVTNIKVLSCIIRVEEFGQKRETKEGDKKMRETIIKTYSPALGPGRGGEVFSRQASLVFG